MTTKSDGGPAFPVNEEAYMRSLHGMSLRDYFAAKAMQALLTRIQMSGAEKAREAYEIADAMLRARKGT